MMKAVAALLVCAMAPLVGCAAPTAEEEATGEAGQAQSKPASSEVSSAFAIDYGASTSVVGSLVVSGRFDTIADAALMKTLPSGDARAAAVCLADRQDNIHGDTLAGLTWKYKKQTYYVLRVGLDDMQGLEDLHMLFVFGADGTPAFQALTWDGKKNVKVTSGRSACIAPGQ